MTDTHPETREAAAWLPAATDDDLMAEAERRGLVGEAIAAELRRAALDWKHLTDGAEPAAKFLRARAAALDGDR